MATKDELKKKVEQDQDFINSKKYDNSISKFVENNSSNRNNDKLICTLLLIEPEELSKLWKSIIDKGRRYFGFHVE